MRSMHRQAYGICRNSFGKYFTSPARKDCAPMPRVKRTRAEQRLTAAAGSDFLEALARGLRVMQVFDRDRQQLTLSDVARLVSLPRASVRRTLCTLVHLGFAETDGRLFRLTPRILRLASAYLTSNAISDILQPAVERLTCPCRQLNPDILVMQAAPGLAAAECDRRSGWHAMPAYPYSRIGASGFGCSSLRKIEVDVEDAARQIRRHGQGSRVGSSR